MDAVEASAPAFLPPPSPLAFRDAVLHRPRGDGVDRAGPSFLIRRVLVFGATAAITVAGEYAMYDVVNVGTVTTLEWLLLALFVALFAWLAFSFVSAVAGFFVLISRARAGLPHAESDAPLTSRTAMLLPTYNEDPGQVTARWRAMLESVETSGEGDRFDWFMLSDTTDPDIWVEEEATFLQLKQTFGARVFYRHRADNHARKSGNIADWIARFGAAYDHMIVLDADSLMEGATIVRLARAMQTHPEVGLIQTPPVIVKGRSLFGRLQQFAGRLYGPMIIAGNAWWQGPDGNYWGHNAIIRVSAFAQDAALPELRGRKPFGGHILSHDFIEAAFLRRAGWAVYAAPSLGGSFEEAPPSLIDFAARDRRWCQGNLQHLAVMPAQGLRWISRLHMSVGVGAYVTAPMWFAFLILGLLISLQAAFVRPEYFPNGFALFPTWPRQNPVLAARLFVITMTLLVLPKLMAFVAMVANGRERRAFGGALRAFAGMILETLLAALIAPAMMVFQSRAVLEILSGRDAGWSVQRREDGAVPRGEVARKLIWPTVCGVLMAAAAYSISVPLLLWMSPVVLGLVAAIPIGLSTSIRWKRPGVLATPEDLAPPPIIVRASELAAAVAASPISALSRLRENNALLEAHVATIVDAPRRPRSKVDVALATAREKVDVCESFAEAGDWLDTREVRALLNDRALLARTLALP